MSEIKFCKCGSLLEFDVCTNMHCPYGDRKNKKWVIGGRMHEFKEYLSYTEAVEEIKRKKVS